MVRPRRALRVNRSNTGLRRWRRRTTTPRNCSKATSTHCAPEAPPLPGRCHGCACALGDANISLVDAKKSLGDAYISWVGALQVAATTRPAPCRLCRASGEGSQQLEGVLGFRFPAAAERSRERMGSPTLKTLQEPVDFLLQSVDFQTLGDARENSDLNQWN
jgi:hypothetical protein